MRVWFDRLSATPDMFVSSPAASIPAALLYSALFVFAEVDRFSHVFAPEPSTIVAMN